MFRPLPIALSVAALLGSVSIGRADPITYDFTGILHYAIPEATSPPYDATAPFSGSFTFDTTPTIAHTISGPIISENGSDVSATVNVGGQVINFFNTPQNPNDVQMAVSVVPTEYEQPQGTPETEFSLLAGINGPLGDGATTSLGLTIYSPGIGVVPANLSNLPLPVFTSSFGLSSSTGEVAGLQAWQEDLTSIELVSTPEPSTLPIFSCLGIAAWAWRTLAMRSQRTRIGRPSA